MQDQSLRHLQLRREWMKVHRYVLACLVLELLSGAGAGLLFESDEYVVNSDLLQI